MKHYGTFFVIPLFLFSASAMSAVAPTITKISVTPKSAPAGTMFKFTAELSNPLPTGYKVKIAFGKGFTEMVGTNQSYSLSRAVFTTGKQNYKVAIMNSKNVTAGVAKSSSYTVTSAAPINHAPTLALIKAETSAITNTAYTVTLNAKDVDANLNAITMNWGDNSEPETVTATDSKDLVFNHTYATASSFGWNAFASDNGTPVLNSKSVSKIVAVSNPAPVEVIAPPVAIPVPAKTTGYTKIANNGSELPDSATLGTNPTDWACTKDNKTGLIWEIKTNDGGLRDRHKRYTWYDPDPSTNGYATYKESNKTCPIYDDKYNRTGEENCDWYKEEAFQGFKNNGQNTFAYTQAVNTQGLCSSSNWRLPTNEELKGLVYCSDGKTITLGKEEYGYICTSSPTGLTINTTYFPNTPRIWFWSSSPYSYFSRNAWSVGFGYGNSDGYGKNDDSGVRLVR